MNRVRRGRVPDVEARQAFATRRLRRRSRSWAAGLFAAAVFLASAGAVAGATSATGVRGPRIIAATVTGYRRSPITGRPSGPITVQVSRRETARLARLVAGLPHHGTRGCHENQLLYRIRFRAFSKGKSKSVAGWRCAAAVTLTAGPGARVEARKDAHCLLLDAVRAVLPRAAVATQTLSVPCAPGTSRRTSFGSSLASGYSNAPLAVSTRRVPAAGCEFMDERTFDARC